MWRKVDNSLTICWNLENLGDIYGFFLLLGAHRRVALVRISVLQLDLSDREVVVMFLLEPTELILR